MRRTSFPYLSVVILSASACQSDPGTTATSPPSAATGGAAGASTMGTGGGGGAVSDGGPRDQSDAPGIDGVVEAGVIVANTPGISLSLYNVVSGAVVARFDPIAGDLARVELPPRFTLQANVPAGTKSVEFKVAGARVSVSDGTPFMMNVAAGQPAAWEVAPGVYDVSVTAYDAAGAAGAASGHFAQTIRILRTGMDPAFVAQDAATNLDWISKNMVSVMTPATFTSSNGHALPYRLFTPPFLSKDVHYPLLVFLHGSSGKGTDNMNTLTKTLFTGERSVVSPNMQEQFPSFVLVPQCAPTEEWASYANGVNGADGSYKQGAQPTESERAALELVDGLLKNQPIDPDRVYLTGVSMGGIGTWDFTARRPELFACGVPMAGFSDRTTATIIKDIPFWIFHGGADMTNPKIGSELMAAKLRMVGDKVVILTEYPGLDHNPTFDRAWTEEPDLLPWIFAWRKH